MGSSLEELHTLRCSTIKDEILELGMGLGVGGQLQSHRKTVSVTIRRTTIFQNSSQSLGLEGGALSQLPSTK